MFVFCETCLSVPGDKNVKSEGVSLSHGWGEKELFEIITSWLQLIIGSSVTLFKYLMQYWICMDFFLVTHSRYSYHLSSRAIIKFRNYLINLHLVHQILNNSFTNLHMLLLLLCRIVGAIITFCLPHLRINKRIGTFLVLN